MKNLFNLTKIYFKETIVGFMGKSKKTQSKSLLLLLVLFIVIGVSLGLNYYTTAEMFVPLGLAQSVLPMGILTSSLVLILTNTKSLGGNFYKSKDYEMLASMPIKNSHIIASRYLSSILVSMFLNLAVLLPAYVVYFIYFKATFANVIFCILSLLLIPTFSQFLGCFISWISNILTAKMKNKNVISAIISLIFIIAVLFMVSILSSESMANLFVNDFPLWIKIVMPYIYFLNRAIIESSFLYFVIFVLLCLVYAIMSVCLIVVRYKTINSCLAVTEKVRKKKELPFKKQTITFWLLKKDAKNFFLSPLYFVNIIIGPVLALALPFAFMGMNNEIMAVPGIDNSAILIMCAFVIPMMFSMSPTTAVSISAEGSSFKLIKSLPISHKTYLWSKILFNILLSLPFLIFSEILCIILLKIEFVAAILIFAIGLLFLYFDSVLTLLINLKFPKLDWTSLAHVVKQSASVLISMFAGIALTILPIMISFVVETIELLPFLMVSATIVLILAIAITIIFETKSKKLFEKIYN